MVWHCDGIKPNKKNRGVVFVYCISCGSGRTFTYAVEGLDRTEAKIERIVALINKTYAANTESLCAKIIFFLRTFVLCSLSSGGNTCISTTAVVGQSPPTSF